MTARVTVIGPGAIGALAAARLVRNANNDVTIAAQTPFTELVVDAPDGEFRSTPRVVTQVEDGTVADWVLVATKTYDSGRRSCKPLCRAI